VAVTVEKAERTPWALRRAVTIMTTENRAHIWKFQRILACKPSKCPPLSHGPSGVRPQIRLDGGAGDLLGQSLHPVLLCGGGAILSRAHDAVEAPLQLGIPCGDPGGRIDSSKITPVHGLLALSTALPKQHGRIRLRYGGRIPTGRVSIRWVWWLPKNARLVHIDIDPLTAEIWCRMVIQRMRPWRFVRFVEAQRKGWSASGDRRITAERKSRRNCSLPGRRPVDTTPVKAMCRGRSSGVWSHTTVQENGSQDLWSYYWTYYQALGRDSVVPPAEQTCMAGGVTGALGAKLARPDRFVVCTTGDGAFQMGMHEVVTSIEEKAPITWVVLDDHAFGWPRWTQKHILGGREIATFRLPIDIVAAARRVLFGARIEAGNRRGLQDAKRANLSGGSAVAVMTRRSLRDV
jgi:acetolactate synthase-1/2/3 large subunit